MTGVVGKWCRLLFVMLVALRWRGSLLANILSARVTLGKRHVVRLAGVVACLTTPSSSN